jgi:eukaryotic-like serine/threonine-protein kinase
MAGLAALAFRGPRAGLEPSDLCYAGEVTESTHPPDSRVGTVIQDRYKILAFVASGGMGVVYRGERLQLGRSVAIKFLHPWVASERSFIERFEVEARAMSRLGHPNCASVIDFGIEDVPFLVMDFVAGRSLRFLLENERLDPVRALGFARQILSGLAHAHAQGIIHRDLKPENIVVSDAPGLVDHVRILDFGLAKLHDGPSLTVGMAVGTPSYMAPEQTLEEGVIDARTDIYGVGVLLFEMLTGSKPFISEKVADLILMQRSQRAPRMSKVKAGAAFSDALEDVVAKALAKAPEHRFASADEMAAALEEVPESTGTRPGAATAVPAPAATEPVVVHENDKTIIDKISLDRTIIDTSRNHDGTPPPHRPQPARVRSRSVQSAGKSISRRQWLVLGTSVGAALGILLGWSLLRGHPKPAPVPAATQAPAVTPTPVVMDELSPMTPDSTPGLADVAQLVRLGLRDQAITVLQEIRRDYPHSAYASFLLAVAYFEKLWWSVGLQHAQAAIQIDPAYRRSPKLAKLLVHSLVSDGFWERGGMFLRQDMTEIAPPYLEEAAQFDKHPRVRARAAQILASFPMRGSTSSGTVEQPNRFDRPLPERN